MAKEAIQYKEKRINISGSMAIHANGECWSAALLEINGESKYFLSDVEGLKGLMKQIDGYLKGIIDE